MNNIAYASLRKRALSNEAAAWIGRREGRAVSLLAKHYERLSAVRRAPVQSAGGVCFGFVFAANPARVAAAANGLHDEGEVDLACAGFVAAGHVCDLDVADQREVGF